ncbi:MAG: hypothetical protein IT376_11215 [Polyangiaceae bacterium]|nr:hypothetical protein [Polyangiaceae bacterium]
MQLADSPVPPGPVEGPASARADAELGPWVRSVALLAIAATLAGRAVAPALPGSRAGIAVAIEVTERIAAWLSQAALLVLFALGTWLLWRTLRSRRLGVALRLVAVPIGAGALTLGLLASRLRLESPITLVLGIGVLTAALACAPGALASARTRAAGLVLLLGATAGGAHLASRVVAAQAAAVSDAARYAIARGLATAGSLGDLLVLALVGAWLLARRRATGAVVALGVTVGSIGVAVVAVRGALPDASFAAVLVARAAAALTRPPAPWLPGLAAMTLDVLALLAALLVAVGRAGAGRSHALHAAVALVLLSRAAADVPLVGLAMLVGALLLRHAEPA